MNIEKAIEIAMKAHKGQKDKGGNPYILHPLWVMNQMDTEQEKIVAVLHDVIEDSDWTLKKLKNEGFENIVLTYLDLLTHKRDVSYSKYIEIIHETQYPIVIKVKLKDLEHNMNILRLKKPLDEKDLFHLNKYVVAWSILKGIANPTERY